MRLGIYSNRCCYIKAIGLASNLEMTTLHISDAYIKKAKEVTPVDTGHLRRSYYVESIDSESVVIANRATYAEYVELGTEQMAPRLMMTSTNNNIDSVLELAYKRMRK